MLALNMFLIDNKDNQMKACDAYNFELT